MTIEHLAFNVSDPVAVAAWYVEHCGFCVVRHNPGPAQTHFLAGGATVIEIYCNPPDQVPNYAAMDPLVFHLAVQSVDALADSKRLSGAGAKIVGETRLADGSLLIMMRDPWGLALQVCQRVTPLLNHQNG